MPPFDFLWQEGSFMKKRYRTILCVMLAVMLTVGGCLPALAGSMDSFVKQREYIDGTFTDISESDWFYGEVVNAYEYGIANGTSGDKFQPYDLVSVAEVIAFAARIHSIYEADGADFTASEDEAWYAPAVEYAVENGLITEDAFKNSYEKPATRAQNAYILANSLPFTEFSNINTSISALPDVAVTDEYYNEIIMLYRAGVLSGKDEYGTFSPTENITRAETAATLNRIVDPSQRRTVTLTPYPSGNDSQQTTEYDAVAVASQASPAVFYIEIYDRNQRALGSGSGFFIAEDGTAVTNYHVIEDAYYAKVKTTDGNVYDVTSVIGYDEANDLAILQVDGSGFPYLELADSDEVKNGQTIFCVGSPLGLENSISEGLVSNSLRTINGQAYIQITAPISSGSSGGAVLDTSCRVIGVSAAGIEDGQNINLAIPSNLINGVARDKNISLYDMQTMGQQTGAESGQAFFYADNSQVPDYGYITGYAELENSYDENTGIMMRTYEMNNSAVIRYLQAVHSVGFSLMGQQTIGPITSMYFSQGDTILAIGADYSSGYVRILYYL